MGFSQRFISLNNFELAFERIVRGQNKDYKAFFQHLFPSYQVGLKDNLKDLISDIKRGRYDPSPPSVVFQPKKTGILRPLRLLTLQDQVVYQAATNVIAMAFKPEQDKFALKRCYGALVNRKGARFFFRGWKGCYRAFDRAILKNFKGGKDFVADFDLVSFYELIDHKLLENVLRRRVKDLDLLGLLFRCLEKWTENHWGIQLHHGIPQGPEPSAFLAECTLFSFDAIRFKDVTYLRYIDDIKLMGKDETQVRRALLNAYLDLMIDPSGDPDQQRDLGRSIEEAMFHELLHACGDVPWKGKHDGVLRQNLVGVGCIKELLLDISAMQ